MINEALALKAESIPTYTVGELNAAVGSLLERGFAPRFLLQASITQSQIKKGHLWLTLSDGNASISAVVWSSKLKQIKFVPNQNDGVIIVGKLNFWEVRASLIVQVLDIRPSISTVLRKFEVVKSIMDKEGFLDETKKKILPKFPSSIVILTSTPSSAMADMLRTAKERWPLTKLFIVPIPVQGNCAVKIKRIFDALITFIAKYNIQVLILARGGGNREDLIVFDDEEVCRSIANFPIPIVTGLGHEDDLTVADLVADYRAATPTAAIVVTLPSRDVAKSYCLQRRQRLDDNVSWSIRAKLQTLKQRHQILKLYLPIKVIQEQRKLLSQKLQLLIALSPEKLLQRGFALVLDDTGRSIKSVEDVSIKQFLKIQLSDGSLTSVTEEIHPSISLK